MPIYFLLSISGCSFPSVRADASKPTLKGAPSYNALTAFDAKNFQRVRGAMGSLVILMVVSSRREKPCVIIHWPVFLTGWQQKVNS
jgi:hypothetical protein